MKKPESRKGMYQTSMRLESRRWAVISAAFFVAGVFYLAMTLMPLVFKRFRGFSKRPLEAGRAHAI